jgi:hypothetical protein
MREKPFRVRRHFSSWRVLSNEITRAFSQCRIGKIRKDWRPILEAEYVSIFKSEDLIEGRKAEAESRPPIFRGR